MTRARPPARPVLACQAMRRPARWLFTLFSAAVLLGQAGCVIVNTRAATRLTLHDAGASRETDPRPIGFKDAVWTARGDGQVEVAAHGWHPREHDTYAFFINEGHPAGDHRLLKLEPDAAGTYTLQLYVRRYLLPTVESGEPGWADVIELTSTAPVKGQISGKRFTAKLRGVAVAATDEPDRGLTVSGTVIAWRRSPDEFSAFLRRFALSPSR